MFQSHDQAVVEQLRRIAEWLERRVSRAEASDPHLAQLKKSEREAAANEAAAKFNPSLPEAEVAKLNSAHEAAVQALVQYVSGK